MSGHCFLFWVLMAFLVSNHLAEEDGWLLYLIALWLSVSLPHGAVSRSAVCERDIYGHILL